ncbi:hypothetical protein HPB51_009409 [Rhipicephalus microplus]|uniref:Transposable element n=1 Tax=Rhipicephalus microplus TaxID=6941 RepID=A0A9J6EG84_RHIMP|nr:hypothetical protein HPB51_009409 [Rhipicephalus microplus]
MNQEVFQALKSRFRKGLLQRMLLCMSQDKQYKLDVLGAVHLVADTWRQLTPTSIANCFRHAGFSLSDLTSDLDDFECDSEDALERRGVLMFDEMSVRQSLHVRESDMALLGKVNLAEHTRPGDNEKDADHVLVFLFWPFLGGWSQTVGTFCTSSAAPGSVVAKLLLQCIVHLENSGAVVQAVTCDNSTSNRSALRSLGIHGDRKNPQTSFQHPCDPSGEIYTVIDPPHIFKCIRNNLQKVGKFLLPEGDVYHDHFKSLLGYEEDQAGLRAVPKLTKAHIMPNAFQKISVRLAVQASNIMTFSCAAAASLEFYSRQDVCKELHDSKATAAFTRRMNGLFDCLNSRRPEHVQCNMNIFQTLKENVTWLNNCCDYIESLPKQRQACFLTKPKSEALRVTLLSTITLVENLLASGFRYVLVENFGQDPLERFFGIARHVAGDGGQPTIQQFLFIYRMLSVNNLVRLPKGASVDGDGPQLLFKLQDLFNKEAAPVNHVRCHIENKRAIDSFSIWNIFSGKELLNRRSLRICTEFIIYLCMIFFHEHACKQRKFSFQVDSLAILLDDVLLEPTESEEEALTDLSLKECILDYLTGYVVQKFSEMCCTDCVESLKGLQRSPSDLILVKSRGYLQVPSTKLLNLLQIAEEHVEEFLVKKTACAGVYMGIVEQVLLDNRTASAAVGCPTHFVGTTAEVLHLFLWCRLHFFTREKNKQSRVTKRATCPAGGGRKPN